jgi:Tol biopolymer transport system component
VIRAGAVLLLSAAAIGALVALRAEGPPSAPPPAAPQTAPSGQAVAAPEPHLRNLRQLTFGGENAEGYLSPRGDQLIFQATPPGASCDQIFVMPLAGGTPRQVSTGRGRTTCSYFFYPDAGRILYSSTHGADPACPPRPDMSQGYVWAIYASFEIYSALPDGTDLRRLTDSPGYDAEATFAFDGSRIVFTSVRDGDLDLYSMRPDGGDVRRLTNTPGYDGGAFYSHDGSKIVYRASRPSPEALPRYRELLARGLVEPRSLEIFVMDADGSNSRQVTANGAANFAPFFHPDGKRIVFASNMGDPRGRNFDLYMVNVDGSGLERVTANPTFDGFPMFSSDGRRLVFASNRLSRVEGETNLFVADWVE